MASEHVHLIGVGGTAMAALAGLLHESGCRISGSDGPLYPPTSTLLEEIGLSLFEGYDAAHLNPCPDLVVIGNAIRRGNAEAEEVLDRGIPYTSMAQLVAERFLRKRHSIVVAGTHGKTTTTSMLAWVLHHAGRDPGFLVGGVPCNFDRSYRLGAGDAFVIEGDEYDTAFFDKGPKFMHYRPDTALVGTIEFDHADIYRDLEQVETVFSRFVNIVPRRGLLVCHQDCAMTREVSRGAHCRVEGYGQDSGTWRAVEIADRPDGVHFHVLHEERSFAAVHMQISGAYNVRNALAVTAACAGQGLSAAEIAAGLATFAGVRRRLEVRGEVAGVTVLDDFAHHPTSVRETLRAMKGRYPGRRIWAVLEPRSWSMRRRVFQQPLSEAFDQADEVIVAGVFRADDIPEEERLDPHALAGTIVDRGNNARCLESADSILAHLEDQMVAGDVVVVMSNGGFDALHERLLAGLRARAGQDAG